MSAPTCREQGGSPWQVPADTARPHRAGGIRRHTKNVTPLCPVSAKRGGIKEEEEEEKEEEEEDEEGKEGKGVGRRAGGKTTIGNVRFGRSSIISLTVQ